MDLTSHLMLLVFSLLLNQMVQSQPAESIRINQEGYFANGPKLAVVVGISRTTGFYIVSDASSDTVYRGKLGAVKRSEWSSLNTRFADFSSLKKKGKYHLTVPGIGNSYSFSIGDQVYDRIGKAVLKGFYYIRSSVPLLPEYAGKWSRGAGHPDTAVWVHASAASLERPEGTILSTPGGWYDAGDYNKYMVNSGITMGTLLSAYEDFPDYFRHLNTLIPESDDEIPDILNEVVYNLRWMLTMQDPNDGGVYHKVTNAAFDGMVMPGVTKLPRYVVQKSTAASLDFAAVAAQASRILKPFEKYLPHLSDSCAQAAVKAWLWSQQHPNDIYDQGELNKKYDPDISTGDYGDKRLNDEWLWAAAELFSTTRSKEYYSEVEKRMGDPAGLPSWSNVALLGYYTLIRSEKQLPKYSQSIIQSMKDTVLRMADQYLTKEATSAFGTVMGQSKADFIWGSNAVAANQGILLINAYLITKDMRYIQGALTNLDYILGRNATGYCFVTGMGTKSPMHPHHRPSQADGIVEPVPGLLAGGPNPGQQDKCAYSFSEPETSYLDDVCSYASNEIAINWNAPIVYLANSLEALWKR